MSRYRCLDCNRALTPKIHAYGRRRVYCDNTCRARASSRRRYVPKAVPATATCETCRATFPRSRKGRHPRWCVSCRADRQYVSNKICRARRAGAL